MHHRLSGPDDGGAAVCWMALRPKDPCRPNYKRKITKAKMRNSPELWAMSAESAIPVFQCGFVVRSLLFRQQQARSASIRFDNYPNACSIGRLLAALKTSLSILPFAFSMSNGTRSNLVRSRRMTN